MTGVTRRAEGQDAGLSVFALNRGKRGADTSFVEHGTELTLEQIRTQYIAGLASKNTALYAAVAVGPALGNFDEAKVLAHRLRGSAGVYGFPVLSRAAGLVEDMLERGETGPELDAVLVTIDELCRTAALELPVDATQVSVEPIS